MTLRSKLALFIFQRYLLIKNSIDSLLTKIEVVLNSTAIIYSVRILIVVVALMMGYKHTPNNHSAFSKFDKMELSEKKIDTMINVVH